MVDSTGSVTDYYEYDAWGNVLPGSFGSMPNLFKWNAAAGCQHIPFTGLYHVGAMEYDPRTARWLQRDPNLYRYCGNDAVNLSDPGGLADGHHVVPREIWDKGNLPSLSTEVRDVFNKSVTGPTNPTHRNSKAHELYNARTKTMFHDWAKIKGIPLEKMTAAQAREFVDVILDSNTPRSRIFSRSWPSKRDDVGDVEVARSVDNRRSPKEKGSKGSGESLSGRRG